MQVAQDSLERLVPAALEESDVTGRDTLEIHLARYEFAARLLRPGRVLDLACGVGYGTRLLADRAGAGADVLGVDVAPEAVAYAESHYAVDGVCYRVGDGMRFEDAEGFDTIVSLETVEHLPEPREFLAHLVTLLRPGGRLVASVPTTPSVDLNPHHLHDFSAASFRRMLRELGLVEIDALEQNQPVPLLPILLRRETRLSDMRASLPSYYLEHPGALWKRVVSTLRYGLANRYLTVACERAASGSA